MLLKEIRKSRNLTQKEVATSLGIKVRHYQYVESGESFLTQKRLNKLEDMFELPQRILLAKSFEEIPIFYQAFIQSKFGTDNTIIDKK